MPREEGSAGSDDGSSGTAGTSGGAAGTGTAGDVTGSGGSAGAGGAGSSGVGGAGGGGGGGEAGSAGMQRDSGVDASVMDAPADVDKRDASVTDAAADVTKDVWVSDGYGGPATFDPSTLYWIQPVNGYPTLALDVDSNQSTNGAIVKQEVFTSMDHAEQFFILDNGNGTVRIPMRDYASCVDNPGSMTAAGTKMQMWTCSPIDTWQQWVITVDTTGPNRYQLQNQASKLYLDQPSGMTTTGLRIQGMPQAHTTAQSWIITPVH